VIFEGRSLIMLCRIFDDGPLALTALKLIHIDL